MRGTPVGVLVIMTVLLSALPAAADASPIGIGHGAGGRFGASRLHTTTVCYKEKRLGTETTYYVDGRTGSDSNRGNAPSRAWQSIERVNHCDLGPRDRVLFAGGQTFRGTLSFAQSRSGLEGRPILVSSFGKGHATIDGGTRDGFRLDGCSWVTVRALDFVGIGRKNGSDGTGVSLNRTRNVELDRIDVSGFRLAGISTSGDENTRITRVVAHDNGFAGITTSGGYGDVPRARNLYIGHCIADNNPGDPKNLTNHSGNGIVVGGLNGAVVEYCEASNNGWDMPRDGNGPVGIWGWDCDRLTIHRCISHDNKSPGNDGGGFDFDGGVTNSVMQYNLSYNNVGCGYLLCQYPGAPSWKNNIVRYNVSVNDGSKNFQAGIGLWLGGSDFSNAEIYNNTILNPEHAVSTLGDAPRMVYRNNLFIGGSDLLVGPFTGSRFENNLYWSTGTGALYHDDKTVYTTLEAWAKATNQETIAGKVVGFYADPKLILPASGQPWPTDPLRLPTMPTCRLQRGSPAIGAGMIIPDNGGCDLFGHHVLQNRRPSLGAVER